MNSPYFNLLLGSVGLSLIVGYLAWSRMRYIRLQLEFAQIRAELQLQSRSRGSLEDAGVQQLLKTLNSLIESPKLICWSWLVAVWLHEFEATKIPGGDSGILESVVRPLRVRLSHRIVTFLLHETIPGWVAFIFLHLINANGERKAERPVTRAIDGGMLVAPMGLRMQWW